MAAFRTTYITNVEVLKTKLKAAKQPPNQIFSAFLFYVGTIAKRVYRWQPTIEEQMVLTSFIEGLHDPQLRWELQWNVLITENQFRKFVLYDCLYMTTT